MLKNLHNHQKNIIFALSLKRKREVLKLQEIEDKLNDLVESLKNYRKSYPKSRELEQYILSLVYEIMDCED